MPGNHVDLDARRQLLGEGGAPPRSVPAHGDAVAPSAVVADQSAVAILNEANLYLLKFNLDESLQARGCNIETCAYWAEPELLQRKSRTAPSGNAVFLVMAISRS